MLFNIPDIQTSFRTLVGFWQNDDPNGLKLTALTTPDSGIYMQSVHPLLTLANLQSICPDFTIYTYPAWSGTAPYGIGDIVTSEGNQYRCIKAGAGFAVSNTTYWEPWNNNKAFTNWLQQRMDGATNLFLNDWIGRKFANRSANNIIERERLYTATGDNVTKITKTAGKVSGKELRAIRSLGARAYATMVSLHFDTAQDITIYLLKSGETAPTKTTTLSYTTAGSVQWFDLPDWELKGEGAYYLYYVNDDVTGQAYNDASEATAWSAGWQLPGSRYLQCHPFTATAVEVGGNTVFNLPDVGYVTETNGLNVQFYVGCSYTDLVIEQRKNFATAYSLFLAKTLLSEIMFNPNSRVNRNESSVSRPEVRYELHGEEKNNSFGLHNKYEKAVSGILLDTTGIDNVCLPCKKVGRLKVGVV